MGHSEEGTQRGLWRVLWTPRPAVDPESVEHTLGQSIPSRAAGLAGDRKGDLR